MCFKTRGARNCDYTVFHCYPFILPKYTHGIISLAEKWPEMVVEWAIVIVIRFYSEYKSSSLLEKLFNYYD